jgi:hypothetical protein
MRLAAIPASETKDFNVGHGEEEEHHNPKQEELQDAGQA